LTAHLVATVALVLGAVTCVTAAAIVRWRMVEETISRAPDDWRFNQMRWYSRPNNSLILCREHRRLYPGSRLRLLYVLLALAAAALVVGAWLV
jgi:hypothetical protein